MFKDEIQRLGNSAGLEGKFCVDWGFDHIMSIIKEKREGVERAAEMLAVAANYIRKHYPDGLTHYDEADCDGYCVADDCESAAERLGLEQHTPPQESEGSETAFLAKRLRRVADLVGLKDAVPEDDATLVGAAGTALGMVARKVEELKARLLAKHKAGYSDGSVTGICEICTEKAQATADRYRKALEEIAEILPMGHTIRERECFVVATKALEPK